MFFSFDGIDGSGKSTQMELFCDWLSVQKGLEVVRCREPGGTPLGERVREILLNEKNVRLDLEAEMFLFMASRSQLVTEVISPALAANKVVVCDRFLMASVVYQGHAGGIDPGLVRSVGDIAVNGTYPDLTFVFGLDPVVAAKRVGQDTDRFESRSQDFLSKVNAGFVNEAARDGVCAELVDAERPIEVIQKQIQQAAERLLIRGNTD
ncbi:MAG: dTMP kinase [Planctomycetota bacterium]|nr:dTMP kinase [Planctomycetota bacterium]